MNTTEICVFIYVLFSAVRRNPSDQVKRPPDRSHARRRRMVENRGSVLLWQFVFFILNFFLFTYTEPQFALQIRLTATHFTVSGILLRF